MFKPNYLRVLDLLEKGGTIKLKGFTLAMSEDGKLGYLGQSSQQGEVLMLLDIPINTFIEWCNELEDKDIPFTIPQLKSR
jgi:hypothetical protein